METEIYEPELLVRASAKISAWGLVVLRPIQQILRLLKIGFACVFVDCLLTLLIQLLTGGCKIVCLIYRWLTQDI